jgi:Raf kinase inhibitor-like YbhB/YbcL family protein
MFFQPRKGTAMKSQLFLQTAQVLLIAMTASVCAIKGGGMPISVFSPAFGNHQPIPAKFTCDGGNVSPPLAISNIPENTKSIVLICDDPDAPGGNWVHWVCYDIPPSVDSLDEMMPDSGPLSCGGKQGTNDFGRTGWGGPCPPSGVHRYFFKVYALDILLDFQAGKTKKEIEKAIKGHITGRGELIGTYARANKTK